VPVHPDDLPDAARDHFHALPSRLMRRTRVASDGMQMLHGAPTWK